MKLSLIILLLFTNHCAFGQDDQFINSEFSQSSLSLETKAYVPYRERTHAHRNNLYFELGGSGGFGSFNYEWNFHSTDRFRWMLRSGISGTFIDKNNGVGLIFPVMVHGVYGKKHGLDIGIGQTLTVTTRGSLFVRAPISIGYRLEPEGKRIFYRFSYTPIVSYLIDFQWQHWGGISIGYKLKTRFK